jgi:TRAP-type C4-dicarboxylate transport system permease small subunit
MKVLRWLDAHFEEFILCVILCVIAIVMFTQIILRNVFSSSLSWSDELCRYLFVWMGGLGVAFATKNESHLRMDILPIMVPAQKVPLQVMCDIVLIVIAVLLLNGSIPFFQNLAKTNQVSAAMQLPMKWVYMSMAVGFSLTILRVVLKYVKLLVKWLQKGKEGVQE